MRRIEQVAALAAAAEGGNGPLLEILRRRLQTSQYHALRRLECEEARAGRVRIRGQVPSFFLKQMAQTVAAAVCGPGLVLDEVEVPRGAQPSG